MRSVADVTTCGYIAGMETGIRELKARDGQLIG
jgi:hypothetical protein